MKNKQKTTRIIVDEAIKEMYSLRKDLNDTHEKQNKEIQERLVWVQTDESDERIEELTNNIYFIERELKRLDDTISLFDSYSASEELDDFTEKYNLPELEDYLRWNRRIQDYAWIPRSNPKDGYMLEIMTSTQDDMTEIESDIQSYGWNSLYDDWVVYEKEFYCMYFIEDGE